MSADLKTLFGKINVENGCFRSSRDKEIAKDIWDRHSLQTLIESSLASKICNEKHIVILTVLIENGPAGWIKIFVDGFNDPSTQSLCISSLRSISKVGEVPSLVSSLNEHGVFDATDFIGVAERASLVLNVLQTLLKKVNSCGREIKELDTWKCAIQIGYFLFGIAAQQASKKLWTNLCSVTLAQDCISLLLETFGCSTAGELLVLDTKHTSPVGDDVHYCVLVKKSIFGKLLLQWKPYLQRNTWRHNPAIASAFSWCLNHLKSPYLSDFIELLLPPCLLFIDDHVAENKEMGTSCLINILQNASGEELRWYGRADVIYEALKLQMYTTEDSLLKITHEALLLTLKVIVKDNKKNLAVTTKYDEIFSLILHAAFHENKLVLRRVHTHTLHVFIERLGINVVKYMKRLLELFEEYLEISDSPFEEARLNTLNALKGLIRTAWPRIPSHSNTIFKILVKLVHQLTSSESQNSKTIDDELMTLAVECLKLLKGIDEGFVTESIQHLKEVPFSDKLHTILKDIDGQSYTELII